MLAAKLNRRHLGLTSSGHERDQVEDYATRKKWTFEQAEKWLAPILNYDPLAAVRNAAE